MKLKCIVFPLLAFSLLTLSCEKNSAVIVTPLNTYSKEDILQKAGDYCKKYGMLPAEVKADKEIWRRLIDDVAREYVYADLSLVHAGEIEAADDPQASEEEIRSKYETLLFSQKKYFTDKKEIVSAAITYPREPVLYYPEGLKWVKSFTLPFEAAVRGQAAILLNEKKQGDYETLIAAAENDMAPLIQEVRQKLRGGIGFDELASEYGAGSAEELLYDKDTGIFPARLAALKTLEKTGDIAEYNIYQGHVFMIFVRKPDYIEMPYEMARDGIEASIKSAKSVLAHDRLMKKLYAESLANGSVKVSIKELKDL
ncbi:MAG: hypothetical protein LBS37_10440 [Treponema sp.]|jgi:hypothetical protein|nr:hypothetical protein [Treponema sp.]